MSKVYEKDGYDSPNSKFYDRIQLEIERIEAKGIKARTASFIVIPDDGIWRKIGYRTFYRLYNLYYITKSDDPKTAGIQKAIDKAQSRIFIKDGIYVMTQGLTFSPPTARPLFIEGESMAVNNGVIIVLNSPSNPQPILHHPSKAPVDCEIILKNLRLHQVFPTSGSFNTPAVLLESNGYQCLFEDVIVTGSKSLTGLPSSTNVPPSGSIGIQNGPASGYSSGDMKIFRRCWVMGYETAFWILGDWTRLYDVVVFSSNKASFAIGSSNANVLMPRLIGCHSYLCGGPYLIDHQYISLRGQFLLDIDNFYAESANTSAGYNPITAIINHPTGHYPSSYNKYKNVVQNLELSTPPPDLNIAGGNGEGPEPLMTTGSGIYYSGTPTSWNRWKPPSEYFTAGKLYQNVNACILNVHVVVQLNPTSTANAEADLLMAPNPPPNYSYWWKKAVMPAGLTAGEVVSLSLKVLPGWYFELLLTNATLLNAIITWEDKV